MLRNGVVAMTVQNAQKALRTRPKDTLRASAASPYLITGSMVEEMLSAIDSRAVQGGIAAVLTTCVRRSARR